MGLVAKLTTRILDYFDRQPKDKGQESQEEKKSSSYAESPSTYVFDQFNVATDRITTIREVRELVKTDLRFKTTNQRLAADATRGGFKVVVQGSEADRKRRQRKGQSWQKRLTPGANIAQQVIDDFMKRTKLSTRSKEYLRVLLRDGDLFLNPIIDLNAGLILDIKRAPALTMKRNSDEYGDFPDIERAFSQIDPKTQIQTLMDIGPPKTSRMDFALFQMNHIRWLCEETEMYGTSHYASARSTHKILQRMERAAAIRREFRSVQKDYHKLPDGTPEKEVIQYARRVGLVDEQGKPTKNAHLLSTFVGTAEVDTLKVEADLSQMGDIEYFDDLLWLNLGIPKAVLTSGQNINRDILKVQYPQYLQSLEDMTDVLEYGDIGPFSGLRSLIDLQLLLAGVNPATVSYDVVWSDKTDVNPTERLERTIKAMDARIITRLKGIQEVADDFDIEDPIEMARMVDEEHERRSTPPPASNPNQEEIDEEDLPKGTDEPLTDVVLEDRPQFQTHEDKAKETVLRFFRSVHNQMTEWEEAELTDAVLMDSLENMILSVLDEAWDAEQGRYQVGIVRWMTESGVMGAERAAKLVAAKHPSKDPESGAVAKPRIVKDDIRSDLLEASGERIRGIKETTRKQLREVLADGFEKNLGWRGLMKQIEPIIVNPTRAEMIARTELSWSYNRSAKRVYADAGYEKVEWFAVIDDRTCPTCRERHQKVYPIDDHPFIPGHPRCRCTLLPAD